MRVALRTLESIRPYEANPRINDQAVAAVAASIRKFGFRQPIVVDPDGVIIVGHARWKAATKLGLKRVPVHVAGDLTPEQARAYRIADNQTADLSGWNYELLAAELGELQAVEFDLEALGFPADQLGALLEGGLREGLTDPDAVPEPPDAATTRPGDLYVLGDHRLLCGDTSKAADVDRLLDGQAVQLVNTDPPYNVKVEPRSAAAIAAATGRDGYPGAEWKKRHPAMTHDQAFDVARGHGGKPGRRRKLRPRDRQLENDYLPPAEFEALLRQWFGQFARVLEPGRAFYIWGGYANAANYPPALGDCELYFSQAIIWVKQHPVLTRKDFLGNHEWCFYGWRLGAGHWFAFGRNNVPDVWEFAPAAADADAANGLDVGTGLVLEAASGARLYVTPAVPAGKQRTAALADGAKQLLRAGPPTDLWRVHKVTPQKMIHLTEKPVELAVRAIQCSTRAGENVLDGFGGSGSTLIACEQSGRRGFLMELDALYCDVIVQRWEAFTGRQAERRPGRGKRSASARPPPKPAAKAAPAKGHK